MTSNLHSIAAVSEHSSRHAQTHLDLLCSPSANSEGAWGQYKPHDWSEVAPCYRKAVLSRLQIRKMRARGGLHSRNEQAVCAVKARPK